MNADEIREALAAASARAAGNFVLVESACEVMHDAYETAAVTQGWETQERSRKPWAEVPEANRETMRAAVRTLLAWLDRSPCESAGGDA